MPKFPRIQINLDDHPLLKAWSRFWPLAYLAAVTAIILSLFSNWAYDDPFITYRYAVNLARGDGFVYNLGEQVLGTTTPLFTIILSILFKFGFKPHPSAVVLGALSLGVGALFFWQLARSWDSPLTGWTGLLLYPTFPLLLNTISSETPIYLALGLAAFATYAREHYSLAALAAALACLARPEGFLIPIILAVHYFLTQKKPFPWKAAAFFALVTLPWIIFAWLYFGSPLPTTFFAKISQGSMTVSQRFLPGLLSFLGASLNEWSWQIRLLVAFIGLWGLHKVDKRWGLFLAWPALYFTSYVLLGVTSYSWYYAPLIPGGMVVIASGVATIQRVFRSTGRAPTWLPGLAVLGVFGLLIAANTYNLLLLRQENDARLEIYRDAGLWLKKHTPVGATVGTLEVGIIGFVSDRTMFDFPGLLHPEVARHLTGAEDFEKGALFVFDAYHPDYLVLHQGFYPQLEAQLDEAGCRFRTRFKGKKYDYKANLVVYSCR